MLTTTTTIAESLTGLPEPLVGSQLDAREATLEKAPGRDLPKSQIYTLVSSVFLTEERTSSSVSDGTVIGITAPVKGEGTSTIAALMAQELARVDRSHTLLVSVADLARLRSEDLVRFEEMWSRNRSTGHWQASDLLRQAEDAGGPWAADIAFRRMVIRSLRRRFANVLIDCRSVREGNDIPAVGSMIDGFILVVRSGGSTREEVQDAIRVVQLTAGVVKGCCFNRRTYPIPGRLYNWFKR